MGTPPAEAVPAEPGDKAGAEAAAAPRSREASQQPQQGSREASQQPQATMGAAAQQPASSSQLAGGSKLSAGSGGSLKRPRGSAGAKGGEESKQVVYGKEVVGRQVGVWSAKAADWPKAVVAQYNAAASQHLLRYLERPAGSIKHHEEWVCLARTRFQWLAAPPPQAKPNPSWDGAPRGDDAVGFKVKVFWPGMSKWYVGKIMSYDPKTKLHSVKYRDGDTAELELRHEAVQYIDKEGTPRARPDAKSRPERRLTAKEQQAAAKGGSGGTPVSAKKAGAGGGAGAASKGGAKRQREESAEPLDSWDRKIKAARSNSTQDTASNAGRAAGGGGAAAAAAPEPPAGGGGGGAGGIAPPTASPPKDAVAGSQHHEVSAAMGDSEEGHGFSGMGAFDDELPSSSGGGGEDDDFGSEVFISEGEMGAEEEEEDSDFEVESYRRGRRGGAISARTARSTGTRSQRRGGSTRSVGSRRDRRGMGSSRRGRPSQSAGGLRSAGGTPRVARRDSVPALRGGPAAAATARKVLRADEETIKTAGAGIVGARVAVCRHDDDVFVKGRLVQFDSYHKRHKVCYDDGEEEWVSLAREPFRWLTPRARSAGCTPEFRTLMQQLGAEDCGAPGVATRRAAASGGGLAVPGEGVAPPAADTCLGWQVSLLFDGDGQWYRGELVGYDPRRGKALLLYDDGEDEWIALDQEELTWHCQLAGPSGVYPGLGRGLEPPAGRTAVGWRVSVYWPADQAFYSGEVVGYDGASGRHEVAYDDGEEGGLDLRVDKVKWVLPPGAAVDREKLEAADAPHRVHHRRRAGDDSDPDFEVLEYRPRAQARRPFALSPAPTPLAGVAASAGRHWDAAEGMEASLADSGPPGQPLRHINLRPVRHPGGAPDPAAAGLGPPLVVRQLSRLTGLASLGGSGGEASVPLPMPITVRIYMSSSTGSAASAETAFAAAEPAAEPAAAQGGEVARLQARLAALERMSRRVAKAQQTIVKGVPTPMPSRSQAVADGDAARLARLVSGAGAGAGAGGAPVTSPTSAQRAAALLASSHASGLHRLARGSTSFSPFHHKRPHPADSEASSSSGSSSEEEGEEGDTGADSADARRRAIAALGAAEGPDAMPLSPRLNGAKIKPLTDGDEGGEGSAASDAMLTAPPLALGAQSPALFSTLRPAPAIPPVPGGLGVPAVVVPAGAAAGDHSLLGSGLGEAALGGGSGHGLPHSASMEGLMLPLPLHPPVLEGLPQPDSMANLMALGGGSGGLGSAPGSRNTSAMLGGHSELLALGQPHDDVLADTGAGGSAPAAAAAVELLGEPLPEAAPEQSMDLDALQSAVEAP